MNEQASAHPASSLSLCGIQLDALTFDGLLEVVCRAHSTGKRAVILNHNLHSLYLYETDAAFCRAYKCATHVYIDGMPVIWLARACGLLVNSSHRITFLDSFYRILRIASERQWRIFYLGSTEETLQKGLGKIRSMYPALQIAGHNGFFGEDLAGAPKVIDEINAFRPDLLFVGMGMPLQEAFITAHVSQLHFSAVLTSGATLDYIAGSAYTPPSWAGPLGLYGVMRMLSNPSRLWKRYLVEPPILIALLLKRCLRRTR